jgi:hypothetical protein
MSVCRISGSEQRTSAGVSRTKEEGTLFFPQSILLDWPQIYEIYEENVQKWLSRTYQNYIKIIIIIVIIIILGISFMQGIYSYIPETNHVPRELCVATILM